MINLSTLFYGLTFGLLDVIALPTIKLVNSGLNKWYMIIPTILYACSPWLFLSALRKETLTIMNLVWDLTSDITVTFIGLYLFKEQLKPLKIIGVILSFISLFLLTYEGDGWNTFLEKKFKLISLLFK